MKNRPSITCPECGLTSYHPRDIENRYCVNCHIFWGDLQNKSFAPMESGAKETPKNATESMGKK